MSKLYILRLKCLLVCLLATLTLGGRPASKPVPPRQGRQPQPGLGSDDADDTESYISNTTNIYPFGSSVDSLSVSSMNNLQRRTLNCPTGHEYCSARGQEGCCRVNQFCTDIAACCSTEDSCTAHGLSTCCYSYDTCCEFKGKPTCCPPRGHAEDITTKFCAAQMLKSASLACTELSVARRAKNAVLEAAVILAMTRAVATIATTPTRRNAVMANTPVIAVMVAVGAVVTTWNFRNVAQTGVPAARAKLAVAIIAATQMRNALMGSASTVQPIPHPHLKPPQCIGRNPRQVTQVARPTARAEDLEEHREEILVEAMCIFHASWQPCFPCC